MDFASSPTSAPLADRSHSADIDPDEPQIDSETAALFRGWLCPLLERADSWDNLRDTLRAKGYALAIRGGRLVLIRDSEDRPFCSLRFLGTSLGELAARLGRPMVRATPGRLAAGEFMTLPAPGALAH